MNAVPASMSSNGPPTQSSRSPSTPTTPTPPSGHAPCLDTSDRNNNATPPRPPNPAQTLQNRPPIPRSPPVGARPLKDLPPGAAPIGSVIRPPVSNAVPLLASQLGHRPVNLDRGQNHAATLASLALGGNLPPLSPHHLNILSHTLSPFAAIPTGNGKIMARNINGTLAVTSHPSNESELQIYRVLQRANLLSYYDTFISQGGDDVQQLCEAGEAEFLEIMDLVGMASKPMHVRRLQKALQEWVQNPALFQTPLVPLSNLTTPSAAAAVIRASSSIGGPSGISAPPTNVPAHMPPVGSRPDPLFSSNTPLVSTSTASRRSVSPPGSMPPLTSSSGLDKSNTSAPHSPSPVGSLISKDNNARESGGVPSPTYSQSGQDYPPLSSSPLQLTPSLADSQIQRIAETAETLIKAMSETVDTKQIKNNKKISKEVEMVLAMSDDDPRKMEEIRRFSAIYGRFDCKRKPEKPLTLHEVSVNEAAAQLCLRKPILLMRRDELFPLARQVVRDSGYQYSKGHSRSQFQAGYPSKIFGLSASGKSGDEENSRDSSNGEGPQAKKRGRYSDSEDGHPTSKKEKFERINEELRQLSDRTEELKQAAGQARDVNDLNTLHAIGQQLEMIQLRQSRLLQEQHAEQRHLRPRVHGRVSTSSDPERPDTDEDSQLSYSNTSSPNHMQTSSQHAGSYVLSASGGQIIAVQNPALSMSGALRASSPTSSSVAAQDSKNLVNLLNMSRRVASGQQAAAAAAAAAAVAAAASAGNGKDHNAKKPTTIIHSDDEEMTFKQEPASPLAASGNISPPRANGK